MNLVLLIIFTAILVGIVYLFRWMMRRWTGYDPRVDVDHFYGIVSNTDWAKRGLAEKRAAAEAEQNRKTRKAKIKGYYEAADINTNYDVLTDADFSHLKMGYSGETEAIPLAQLLAVEEEEQRKS